MVAVSLSSIYLKKDHSRRERRMTHSSPPRQREITLDAVSTSLNLRMARCGWHLDCQPTSCLLLKATASVGTHLSVLTGMTVGQPLINKSLAKGMQKHTIISTGRTFRQNTRLTYSSYIWVGTKLILKLSQRSQLLSVSEKIGQHQVKLMGPYYVSHRDRRKGNKRMRNRLIRETVETNLNHLVNVEIAE